MYNDENVPVPNKVINSGQVFGTKSEAKCTTMCLHVPFIVVYFYF